MIARVLTGGLVSPPAMNREKNKKQLARDGFLLHNLASSKLAIQAGVGMLVLLVAGALPAQGVIGRETTGLADVSEPPGGESALEAEILGVLADATEIATKTRMNADYVPGILTILRREEMLALGVRTVADALGLVPGMVIDRRQDGRFSTSLRGLDNGNTEVKVMIDSVPLTTSVAGSATYFELPIAQVERIEVIRGPGSALYGEGAFAGLINVVTYDRPLFHLRHGDNGTTEVCAIYRHDDPLRDLSLRVNLAAWDSRGADLWVETDLLHRIGLGSVSNAPGAVDDGERYRFGQLKLDWANVALFAQYQRNGKNPFFGATGVLPDPSPQDESLDVSEWVIQGRIGFAPAAKLNGALILRWHHRGSHFDARIRPPGAPALPGSPILPDGLDAERQISSARTQAEAFLEWTGWASHRVRFEVSLARERVLDAWRAYNADIFTFEPLPEMQRYGGALAPLDPNAVRTIASLAIQDEWSLRPNLDLTLGARYDHYSDLSGSLSPRLAGVWRLTDKHLLKAQIAGAFFPPTLLQRYYVPLPPLEVETPNDEQRVTTGEISYIYRQPNSVFRATLYHSNLYDVIVTTPEGLFNRGEERLAGIELEWEQRFSRDFKLEANLSYADTLNKDNDAPLPGAAKWLGNLAFFYNPRKNLMLTGRWRHVGDRVRDPLDSRTQPLSDYNDLSLTLSWFHVGVKGLTLRAGATNLLNAAIHSPAPAETYEGDYPLTDTRALWAQIAYTLP
jgi:iron complex outermembrane receptor protein